MLNYITAFQIFYLISTCIDYISIIKIYTKECLCEDKDPGLSLKTVELLANKAEKPISHGLSLNIGSILIISIYIMYKYYLGYTVEDSINTMLLLHFIYAMMWIYSVVFFLFFFKNRGVLDMSGCYSHKGIQRAVQRGFCYFILVAMLILLGN